MTAWTLLVMAAGGSARYGKLKQTDPIGPNGETLIDYSVFDASRYGCRKVVFVIRRDIETVFRNAVGRRIEMQLDVDYAYQDEVVPTISRKKPWGTAQAVLSAANVIKEPFAVINADDHYGHDPFRALGEHFSSEGEEAVLVGFRLQDTLSDFGPVKRGLCTTSAGYLESVVEVDQVQAVHDTIFYSDVDGIRRQLTGDEIVSMNVWGFYPEILDNVHDKWIKFIRDHGHNEQIEFYIPNVVGQLIAEGKSTCRVLKASGNWFGITYPEDRPLAIGYIQNMVNAGVYPEKLWTLF